MTEGPRRALILAGRRGNVDSLAVSAGVPHRALIEVGGQPILERVVAALREAGVGAIHVCSDDASLPEATPTLAALHAAGALLHQPAAASPAASVAAFLEGCADGESVLVTTADHALLSAEMVEHFGREAAQAQADVVVAVVEAARVRARFPNARRTFIPLADGAVTGANLFWMRASRAQRVARLWIRAESVRKRPWRLVALFGPGALLRFALRRLSLDAALERVSRAAEARVEAVRMPFAECAVDVDTEPDLELVRGIAGAALRASDGPPA